MLIFELLSRSPADVTDFFEKYTVKKMNANFINGQFKIQISVLTSKTKKDQHLRVRKEKLKNVFQGE